MDAKEKRESAEAVASSLKALEYRRHELAEAEPGTEAQEKAVADYAAIHSTHAVDLRRVAEAFRPKDKRG